MQREDQDCWDEHRKLFEKFDSNEIRKLCKTLDWDELLKKSMKVEAQAKAALHKKLLLYQVVGVFAGICLGLLSGLENNFVDRAR